MRWSNPVKARRKHLTFDLLETRQVLSGFQPSAAEQLFLEQLNDARANPTAYGHSIGLDLSTIAPSQPLAFDPLLIQAARLHSQDMSDRDYFAHNTPENVDPGMRMTAAGFNWNSWGESIAAGSAYPATSDALQGLIVDAGVANLGHRRHLLAVDNIFKNQNEVGIGVVWNGTGSLTNYYTVDTASGVSSQVFLTGVVFNDGNGNGKYDIGEGVSGATVSIQGVGTTTSFISGGYTLPVSPGTYTVTASGGGLASPISRMVTVGSVNVRQNLTGGNDVWVQKLYQTILGRTPTSPEIAPWVALMAGPGGPSAVALAIENSAEAHTRQVAGWYSTYLGRSPSHGEEQGWVNAMVHGVRDEDVLAGILGSPEYYSRASQGTTGTADQRYIQTLYSVLLKRTASSSEVNSWVSALHSVGRSPVTSSFVFSAEFRSGCVISYYSGLLHRSTAPSAAEVSGWANTGLNLCQIRVSFEASQEYYLNG